MPVRYFNWKLAAVVLIGLAVLAATALGLRQWQRSHRAQRGLTIGIKAFEQGDWEQAAKYLGSHIAVVQNDVPALLKYAEAQLNIRPVNRNNIRQAMSAYHIVLRLEPGNIEAATRLAEVYLNTNMPGEAELVAGRCLQTASSYELRRILAVSLANQRKITEAATEIKKVLDENPQQIWAYEAMGRLAEQRTDDFPQGPGFWFDKGVTENPSSAEAYIARAMYFIRHGQKDNAVADLTKAQQLDLPDSRRRLSLAQQLVNAGLLEDAKKQLDIVLAKEPKNQMLWFTLAQLALKYDSVEESCRVAENGLKELASQPYDFMPLAAQLFIRCGQLDKASECIDTMKQKDINPATTAYLDGLIAETKGKSYEAVENWRRAIELGSKSASVRLSLAKTLSRLGDRSSALNQLRTLVAEQPNNFEGCMTLARMLAEARQWPAAIEQIRAARNIQPLNADAALLEIQVRLQMLGENDSTADPAVYQEMENTLSKLDIAAPQAVEVKLVKLQLSLNRGDFNDAGTIAALLREKYPDDHRVISAQAKLLVAQNKTNEAIALLTESVQRLPGSAALPANLVELLNTRQQYDQAEQVVQNALENAQTPAEKRELGLMLAEVYAVAKQPDKRLDVLDSLSQQFKDDVHILRKLLSCEKVLNDSIRAQQIVDRIKTIGGPNNWQWRYEQARVWYSQKDFEGNYPKIISLLGENLLANPDDQASRAIIAQSHNRAGKNRLTIAAYDEALSRSPRDVWIIARLASALYAANEFDRAQDVLQQAAKSGVEHPDLMRLELQGYLSRGRLKSASEVLANLLREDPNNDQIGLSLALLKMQQGDFLGAKSLLDNIAGRGGDDFAVTTAQIELKVRQGLGGEALQLCEKVIQQKNNAFSYILRGRVKAMLDDRQSAVGDFRKAVEMEPNNIDVLLAKIDFAGASGMIEEAITDVNNALLLAPDNITVQQRAVAILLSSKKADLRKRGKEILNKAIETNPRDVRFQLQKVRLLLASNATPSLGQAVGILENIIETQPAESEAWTLLASASLDQGQTSKAIDVTMRGLVYKPGDKSLMLLKARAEAVRSPSLAIPTLKAVLEMEPNNADFVLLLADTYMKSGEFEKAVQILKSRAASCPKADDRRRLNLAAASAMYKSGNVAEANEILKTTYASAPDDPGPLFVELGQLKNAGLWDNLSQKALDWCSAHPNNVRAAIMVADALASMKNDGADKAAEILYRDALSREPNLPSVYSKLGLLLQMAGRFPEAVKLYEQNLVLEPENVIVMNNLAWILCEEQGKFNEALALAERGLAMEPDYADLIDTRGMVYYRLAKLDLAIEDFRRCVLLYSKQSPALVNSHFHLGIALARRGEKLEASKQLAKALELDSEIKVLTAEDSAEAHRLIESLSKGGS